MTAEPVVQLRIVGGNPTAEDVAAVVTVLTAARSCASNGEEPSHNGWSAPANMHRDAMPHPHAHAWRKLGSR